MKWIRFTDKLPKKKYLLMLKMIHEGEDTARKGEYKGVNKQKHHRRNGIHKMRWLDAKTKTHQDGGIDEKLWEWRAI